MKTAALFSPQSLHAHFLSLVPRIVTHGRIYFRKLKCQQKKEDAVAEMVALSWVWFVRLAKKGKDASEFPSALATFAARAVKNGRRLTGMEKTKDVLSQLAQTRRNFTVCSLPSISSLCGSVIDEALQDNTQTPVDEQVAFRIDFPCWLRTRTERQRRIVEDMITGERTLDVADKYGMTSGRVSQLRREFHQDWERFCGDQDTRLR